MDRIPLGTSSIAQKPKGFFTIPIVERRSQTMMIKYYTLPFCSTLALIAIPRPIASGLQTGGHGRANRMVKFIYKGKKEKGKFQLVQADAQLSNRVSHFGFILPTELY